MSVNPDKPKTTGQIIYVGTPIKKEGTVSKSFSNSIGLSWQTEFWTLLREKMKFFLERYCSEFLSIWVTEDIVIHESCDEQTQR